MIKYLENDLEKEIANKTVLIDFYANWCGPCKMFSEVLNEVSSKINIDIIKIDIDKFAEIAHKYGVMSIPTISILNNGKVVKSHVGYLNSQELLDFINQN